MDLTKLWKQVALCGMPSQTCDFKPYVEQPKVKAPRSSAFVGLLSNYTLQNAPSAWAALPRSSCSTEVCQPRFLAIKRFTQVLEYSRIAPTTFLGTKSVYLPSISGGNLAPGLSKHDRFVIFSLQLIFCVATRSKKLLRHGWT